MKFEQIKNNLTKETWESLDDYQKYAYLKTFIPFTADGKYAIALRKLKLFLSMKNTV